MSCQKPELETYSCKRNVVLLLVALRTESNSGLKHILLKLNSETKVTCNVVDRMKNATKGFVGTE
jgi:hypothetical protein